MTAALADPNNIDLWKVIFVYHWNWVAIVLVLILSGASVRISS